MNWRSGRRGVVSAVAVVAALGVAVFVAEPGGNSLPRLSLVSVPAGTVDGASALPAMASGVAAGYGWGQWKLVGTLPQGPAAAPVHRLPAGTSEAATVKRLAASLGMNAAPRHLDGGWYVLDGTRELSVSERAGRHWVYADHGCVAGPVLDPLQGVACAIASPGLITPVRAPSGAGSGSVATVHPPPTPTPTVAPLSAQAAFAVARPVLQAVGADPAAAGVESAADRTDVVLRPQVGGFQVVGMETRVSVGAEGRITDASGWLATPVTGLDYPLLSAQDAFGRLRDQAVPLMAQMPCPVTPAGTGCAAAPDRVVTGARLGLVLGYGGGGDVLLVPAWMFDVRGQSEPAVLVAVNPTYLSTGGTRSGPGTGGGSAGSTGANPATAAPAPPGPATEPSTAPGAGTASPR